VKSSLSLSLSTHNRSPPIEPTGLGRPFLLGTRSSRRPRSAVCGERYAAPADVDLGVPRCPCLDSFAETRAALTVADRVGVADADLDPTTLLELVERFGVVSDVEPTRTGLGVGPGATSDGRSAAGEAASAFGSRELSHALSSAKLMRQL
jgi:hypothetical protein